MQKNILKNTMIKKALDNFIESKHNYEPRVRDTKPFKALTNELNIALNPIYKMKEQIGSRLIWKIRRELGVK